MIETEIQQLAAQAPDHRLTTLETDIWAGVAEHTAVMRASKRLVAAQFGVLAVALIGSLVAGQYWGSSRHAVILDVFSPRMTLSAATLLVGQER